MRQIELYEAVTGLKRGTDEARGLMRRARELFPGSRHLRHQWFRVKMQFDLNPTRESAQIGIAHGKETGIAAVSKRCVSI